MPETAKPSQGLTKREVADIFGVSLASVDRAIGRGELMAYKVGALVRVTEDEVARVQSRKPRPDHDLLGNFTPEVIAEIRAAVDHWPAFTPEQKHVIATQFAAPPPDAA